MAIRATATTETRLLRGQRRVVRYDVRYPDGRAEQDVNLDRVRQGGRFPADAQATRVAASAACPDVGAGDWVEYATGRGLSD